MSLQNPKPIDEARALALLHKGNTVGGITSTLSIGRGRARELRQIGENAGLVYDYRTGRMAAEAGWNNPPAPPRRRRPPRRAAEPVTADGLAWQDKARCRHEDPELFFSDAAELVAAAKAACGACPVRAECLRYVGARPGLAGIWGGLTEDERRERRKAAA